MAGLSSAYALDDQSLKGQVSIPEIQTPQVYRAFLADRVDTGGILKEAVTGASFWDKVLKKHGIGWQAIIASNNELIGNGAVTQALSPYERGHLGKINADGSDLKIGQVVIFEDSTDNAEKNVELYENMEPVLGQEIHIAVWTENLPGETVVVRVMQGNEDLLASKDSPVKVDHDGATVTEVKMKVGEFYDDLCAADPDNLIVDKERYKDWAVAKIRLTDQGKALSQSPTHHDLIRSANDRRSKLYLEVDAHSHHSENILERMICYFGGKDEERSTWWKADEDGTRWIELRSAAWAEPVENPQKLQYNYYGEFLPSSGAFGRVRNGGTKNHQGVDIFAKIGTPVFACLDGVVETAVASTGDYGKYIVIRLDRPSDLHDARNDGYTLEFADKNEVEKGPSYGDGPDRFVFYAHLDTIEVKARARVTAGQRIGTTGKSGNAEDGSQKNRHLHFEIRDSDTPGKGLLNRTNPAFYITWTSPDKATQAANTDPV